jgi:hypothetical protein
MIWLKVLARWILGLKTDPVSETSCFLVSRIPDDGKVKKKKTVIVQASLVCIWKVPGSKLLRDTEYPD